MGTAQASQPLAAPLIRLTNSAAEFIDHLNEDFHPALPNSAIQYDSEAHDYHMKEDMKQSDALKERKVFLASMKAYQTRDGDDSRAKLGLISESKWSAVLEKIK